MLDLRDAPVRQFIRRAEASGRVRPLAALPLRFPARDRRPAAAAVRLRRAERLRRGVHAERTCFLAIKEQDPERFKRLLEMAARNAAQRRSIYQQLASMTV